MQFPPVCPEVPVLSLTAALAYYRDQLGFTIDWSDEQLGLAGLSRGDTRLFMTTAEYRAALGNQGPLVLWLNLSSRAEVDALHEQWATAGARIADPPEAKPFKLYEFFAEDIDGNYFRVFYDFGWEERYGVPRREAGRAGGRISLCALDRGTTVSHHSSGPRCDRGVESPSDARRARA